MPDSTPSASVSSLECFHPNFKDPRFTITHVSEAQTCRHFGCAKLAEYLVEYEMKRDGWVYDYECGYCSEHAPSKVRRFNDA